MTCLFRDIGSGGANGEAERFRGGADLTINRSYSTYNTVLRHEMAPK